MSQVETDCFRLGRHAMFRTLCDKLSADNGPTTRNAQNLIESKDDMLFAWQPSDCSVLCLNWRAAYAKDTETVTYQVSVFRTRALCLRWT